MRAFSIATGLLVVLSLLMLIAGAILLVVGAGSSGAGWFAMWAAGFVFALAMFIEGVHVGMRQIIALLNENRKLLAGRVEKRG